MMGSVPAEGQYTSTIYGAIKEGDYDEAIRILSFELENFPRSRAALSLLGYCYYHKQEYLPAAYTYEELTRVCPHVQEYRIYHAQSLFKSGQLAEALRVILRVDGADAEQRLLMLQASIKYEQDELGQCKGLLDRCLQDDPDVVINAAAISFKNGEYEKARTQYGEAINALGYAPELSYNVALCHYKEKDYGQALRHIAEIIERGVREHPELSVGSNTEGIEVRSVGNSPVLRETCLIEAFNLKAAIEFATGNQAAAVEALSDMPPRLQEELDPVTLHNEALISMDEKPNPGFRKLNFLLENPPYPPEAFGNLLLLQSRYEFYDMAADLMANNPELTYKYLSAELFDYLDATILTQTSPEEAYRKYDVLTNRHIGLLRTLTKTIQDARLRQDNDALKESLADYDEALEKYIPVLMAQARIYWEREQFEQVELLFRQSAEFCSEHDTWKVSVAHVFFMQDKFKEAIRYYAPIVGKHGDSVLDVPAIVLANLCVSYIMTSQNDEAEALMRKIEKEEERVSYLDSDKPVYHLCIVNLVIGTLYCAKDNFEFGISRIIKSLEPYDRKKIGPDTWFHAKRCFLALAEQMAKQMFTLKDESMHEIVNFLDQADEHGTRVVTVVGGVVPEAAGGAAAAAAAAAEAKEDPAALSTHTVSYEARQLKRIFLKIMAG